MTINFVSLMFIWLLPLTAGDMVTSGQNHTFTDVMTAEAGSKFPHDQPTTQEASSLSQLSEVSSPGVTVVNPPEEITTKPVTLLQTAPATPLLPNIERATPTTSRSSQIISSTAGTKSTTGGPFQVRTSAAATAVTRQTGNLTTATGVPPMSKGSTISQDTSTSQFINKTTQSSTHPTQSMNLTSTAKTSTESVANKSASTSPVTSGGATQSTGLYKTSRATMKTPVVTRAKKKQIHPENKEDGVNNGKVVAGVIGGALAFMMLGFLLIYIKKRKLQRQQITTSDWAGPSPFLDGGADNGQVTMRLSNRISLPSFLPQRLSKRLSLLPETDEELEEIMPGTTFGDQHHESTFSQEVEGNEGNGVQESNGTAVVFPEAKSTGDTPEKPVENSEPSTQTTDVPSTNNNEKLGEDNPANPPSPAGPVENTPAQADDGVGQP